MLVSNVVPANPSSAAPSRVTATACAVNRPAPAAAAAAEHHSSPARDSRRAAAAKVAPASSAPPDHSAEYTPTMA